MQIFDIISSKASEICSIFPTFLTHSIIKFAIFKIHRTSGLENGDFSRRKLSVIRGILISDNEEKTCFQDLEAGSDYSLSAIDAIVGF